MKKRSYLYFRELADAAGLSNYQVAMRAGVPQSCLSYWKAGTVVPKWRRMERIARILSTPERPLTAASFYEQDDLDDETTGKCGE